MSDSVRRARFLHGIFSDEGACIGALLAGPGGVHAVLRPGATEDEIEAAMDFLEPVFARAMEARRQFERRRFAAIPNTNRDETPV